MAWKQGHAARNVPSAVSACTSPSYWSTSRLLLLPIALVGFRNARAPPCSSVVSTQHFTVVFIRWKTQLAILLALHTPLINMIVDGMELFEDDDLARPASPSHSKVKRAVARAQFLFSSNSASLAVWDKVCYECTLSSLPSFSPTYFSLLNE